MLTAKTYTKLHVEILVPLGAVRTVAVRDDGQLVEGEEVRMEALDYKENLLREGTSLVNEDCMANVEKVASGADCVNHILDAPVSKK